MDDLQEKFAMLREKESLVKENEKVKHERDCLLRNKEVADGQIAALTRSVDSLQKNLKEKENKVLPNSLCVWLLILASSIGKFTV